MKTLLASLLLFFCSSATATVVLEILGGDSQTATVGTAFGERIRVRALHADGTPLVKGVIEFGLDNQDYEGPVVLFRNDSGSYNSVVCVTITDAGGFAQSPEFRRDWGVGPGVIDVRLYDPVTREVIPGSVKYISTYGDGTLVKSFQDLWWGGAAESGWGVMVAQQETRLFNVVYAYDAAGEPTWFVASQGSWNLAGFGTVYGGDLHSPTSAPYFAYDALRFKPGTVRGSYGLLFDHAVGNRLYMNSIPSGTASFTQKTLQRYEFAAGSTMPLQGVAGLWWGGASQNGWGISIVERPGALFVVWFTYGADGKPVWFSMSDARASGANTWTGNVYRTTGSAWVGVAYDASHFQAKNVGTFELHFDGTQRATFTFDVEGHRGVLPLERFTF